MLQLMTTSIAIKIFLVYLNKYCVLNLPASAKQHLIIFTCYPDPGKTKTQLIPALGSIDAANFNAR